jgi:hypothetical protein
MVQKKFELDVTGPTTAYLKLPTYSEDSKRLHTVTLVDLLGAYRGPYVVFDFDDHGVLVGIELIDESEDDDDAEEANEVKGKE